MTIGIQDAKEQGYDWVKSEYERLLEDLDRDANYFNVIRIAKEQMEQEEERAAVQEQKLAEVDQMELPMDFDADFGTVGLNDVVRQMLKEERANNFVEFNAEFDRIQAEAAEKIRGYEEREVILERNNAQLQEEINLQMTNAEYAKEQFTEAQQRIKELEVELANEVNRRIEVEQNRKNAADQLAEAQNEIVRLEDQVDELRRANALGERQAQRIIDVTESTKSLYEAAKQATAEKRQVKITGQIGANFNTVELPDGTTDVLHKDVIQSEYETVETFQYPEAPEILEHDPSGTEPSDTETDMVHGGSETDVSCGQDQTEPHSLPSVSAEAHEDPQETAHSEEVGETVSRAEFDALRKDVEKIKAHVGYVEIGHGVAA